MFLDLILLLDSRRPSGLSALARAQARVAAEGALAQAQEQLRELTRARSAAEHDLARVGAARAALEREAEQVEAQAAAIRARLRLQQLHGGGGGGAAAAPFAQRQ